jgi:hypothetical protein
LGLGEPAIVAFPTFHVWFFFVVHLPPLLLPLLLLPLF